MKYLLLILLLILIVGLVFYLNKYKKSIEKFQSSLVKLTETDTCKFVPWGSSRKGCINRCLSDDKLYWGGDSCDLGNCQKICDNCDNKSRCKWKTIKRHEAAIIEEQLPPNLTIRVVPGDSEAIIFWENVNNDLNKNTSFIIKYFKTYDTLDGISVETIKLNEKDIKKNRRNYKHTIKGLTNNETYSIVLFACNSYAIGNPSNIVVIKPKKNDKLLLPN